jgi:putative flavoprotein involved in K+ transport
MRNTCVRTRRAFQIDVELQSAVTNIHGGPPYTVETNRGTWHAPTVVVATGMFGEYVLPVIPGLERYSGQTLHTAAYKTGRDYAGKRVLIVGLGNTAAELAADLVEHGAATVSISVRTTPPVAPRDFLGTPVQLFGIALSGVRPRVSDWIGSMLSRVALGDLTRHGLPKPEWLPFSAKRIPVIDVGFVRELKRGRIALRPLIERFSEDGVVFSDGSAEAFDVVLFATGYRTGLETILDVPAASPDLYFMGFIESHRGALFEIEIASRRLARTIASRQLKWTKHELKRYLDLALFVGIVTTKPNFQNTA